jgi:hypothetical protein
MMITASQGGQSFFYGVFGMIKKVFFTAALLASSLAYGANPSVDISVQVVPAGNGGIACDIGPNYTGTIPAAAQAVGFTHCALYFRFDDAYSGNLANWLDCKGATSPIWINSGYSSPATPCSRYNIIFDAAAGKNVLDMTFTPADAVSSEMTWMVTQNGASNAPLFSVPFGHYAEAGFRTTPQTLTAPGSTFSDILSFFSFGDGSSQQHMEWDVVELFSPNSPINGDGGAGCIEWGGIGSAACPGHPTFFQFNSSFNPTNYNSFGELATGNSSANSFAKCAFLNGATYYCNAARALQNIPPYTVRYPYQIGVGLQNTSLPRTISSNMDMYIDHILFLTCANYKAPAESCPTTPYTGP